MSYFNSQRRLPVAPAVLFLLLSNCLPSPAGETRLTTDGTNKRDPSFINGGDSIAYSYDEKDDLIRAVTLDLTNPKSEPKPLFDDGPSHQTEIAFSPDGNFVTFNQCTGNLTAKLVIRNLKTNNDAEITHGGRGGYRGQTFSPDGQRVIYAFAETGPQQLWSVNLEAKDKKQLTECQGISHWPSFTPDGNQIVFSNSRENNYEIYVMGADGNNEQRLTENTIMDIRPRVSPDGSRVAFVSMRDGNYEVYVMNIDGSNVRRITNNEERDDYPNWHPNGKQLVFVSERDGKFDLYLIDLEPEPDVASK